MRILHDRSQSRSHGFTLIKTMMAIGILTMVLTAAIRLIGVSAKTVQNNRKQLTAVYLGQQCLEWTRNVRDSAWRQNLPWDCGFRSSGGMLLSTGAIKPGAGNSGNCGKDLGFTILPFTSSQGIVQRSGEDTIYTRKLDIVSNGTEELLIRCNIDWESSSLEFEHILTDWKK